MQLRLIVIGVVAIVLVAAGFWWWQSRTTAEPVAPAPVVAPQPPSTSVDDTEVPATPAVQPQQLPPLNESDEFVREQIVAIPSQQLDDWLTQQDLVRRLAVVIDNAAGGDYPRRQLGFLAPTGKFTVTTDGDRFKLDPQAYQRFDPFVDAALSVPPQQAAALLSEMAPLLAQAMKELGQLDPDPVAAVRKGIDQVLATPVVEGEIELVQPKVFYLYADPQLEALAPLQKQLLRMGPSNVQRIKAYLTQVKALL